MSTTGSTASTTAFSWASSRASTTGSSSSRTPRVNPQARLMSRFYEPLVLLHVLDLKSGERTSRCPSGEEPHLPSRELRRTFLEQLAYVCDYEKGGDRVTAIGLEADPAVVVFWVACNNTFTTKARCFLQELLNLLQRLRALTDDRSRKSLEEGITEWCINFNLHRIKSYQRDLLRQLVPCLKHVRDSEDATDRHLAVWLQTFKAFKTRLPDLCLHAYQARSDPRLSDLNRHIGNETSHITDVESRRQQFLLTRHYIGRLGSHIRAARILITASQRLPELFDNFIIKILPSPGALPTPPPTDNLTTLDGIVKRMLSKDSSDLKLYQDALATMDKKFDIHEKLLATYENKDFKPRVHAELNLLEHFYKKKLPFVDDDRFIGCSKPACYCCYHYICSHPGDFARPASHGIKYLAWRPPDIGQDKSDWIHQREIMNKVIAQIRRDTFRQIDQRKGPGPWHPDSTSGITYSIPWNGFKYQPAFEEDEVVEVDETSDREERDESPVTVINTPRSASGISNRGQRHESPDSVETAQVINYSSDREQDYESPVSSVTTPTRITNEKMPAYIQNKDDSSDSEPDIGGASL